MKKFLHYPIGYAALSIIGLLLFWLYFLLTPVVTDTGGVVYDLRPGTSKATVILELSQQHIVNHSLAFSLYVYPQVNAHLKTGEYLFPKGSTLVSIWRQISNGKGHFYRPFIIIPGWTFVQLRNALSAAPGLKHLTANFTEQQIMAELGHPTLAAEGEFFPETYYYTEGNIDLVMLKRALI